MTQKEETETEEKLFVVYWDDGYVGGPFAELHNLDEIGDFAGIEPLNLASLRMLEVDQIYVAYAPASAVKFWRVE